VHDPGWTSVDAHGVEPGEREAPDVEAQAGGDAHADAVEQHEDLPGVAAAKLHEGGLPEARDPPDADAGDFFEGVGEPLSAARADVVERDLGDVPGGKARVLEVAGGGDDGAHGVVALLVFLVGGGRILGPDKKRQPGEDCRQGEAKERGVQRFRAMARSISTEDSPE